MSKENFIEMLLPFAKEAEAVCGVNPVVLLAQAALESDWGTSPVAKRYHNYFHSCGYGRPNRFWEGDQVQVHGCELLFRSYADPRNCFMDYAHRILTFPAKELVTLCPEAFLKENPEEREEYCRRMLSAEAFIEKYIN